MKKAGIRNIIFDLGGVIINLDTSLTLHEMARLLNKSYEEVLRIFYEDDGFKKYETGHISDDQFRAFIKRFSKTELSDEAIDVAWNAMILDLPSEHMNMLRELRSHYSTYLLSNTNGIHLDYVNTRFPVDGVGSFSEVFDKAYYSHLVGLRKPNEEIYEYVLKDRGITASETLFFDDNEDNIRGAQSVGIQTFHVKTPADVLTYFYGE